MFQCFVNQNAHVYKTVNMVVIYYK